MWKICALTFFTALLLHTADSAGPIKGIIQTNFIGFPNIHEKQTWIFDPEISFKRRNTFAEVHGYRGEKFIERIGLGYDGNEEQRRQEQSERDRGHLGGLNAYLD